MTSDFLLKPIYSRKLKNNDWVIYAVDSSLLVVDESTAKSLTRDDKFLEKCDESFLNLLSECGYLRDSLDHPQHIPFEETTFLYKILRHAMLFTGVISITFIFILIPMVGIPRGNNLFSSDSGLWNELIVVAMFSMSTTLIHEIMHMIFAKTFTYYRGGLRFYIKRSTVTVSMTHIWVWSIISRITALSAGMIADLLLLASLSFIRLNNDSWIFVAGSIILWIRILWQLRFHKKCDGQLLAMTILDNPMITVDVKNKHLRRNKDVKIWKNLTVIGYLVDFFLLAFWIIPFVLSVFSLILSL